MRKYQALYHNNVNFVARYFRKNLDILESILPENGDYRQKGIILTVLVQKVNFDSDLMECLGSVGLVELVRSA